MIWVAVFAVALFLFGWEILALATHGKYFSTWSRYIWKIQEKWPKSKEIILLIVLGIGILVTGWLAIHFYFGECAFGIC